MLELILPAGFPDHAQAEIETVNTVYEAGITPYWWKLAGSDSASHWRNLAEILEHHDPHSRIILLGGGQEIAQISPLFRTLKSCEKVSGFAIGRSIFWPSWQRFLKDEIDLKEISKLIAKDFLQCIRLWQEA